MLRFCLVFLNLSCHVLILKGQNGIKADYFNGTSFDQYVTTRIESRIDASWNNTPPVPRLDPHNCSIRYSGFLKAPESGVFTFSAKVDDGIRVWLGDKLIIDQWGLNDQGDFQSAVNLNAGENYTLKVEYFNALVEGDIQLIWQKPSDKSIFGTFFSNSEVIGNQHFNYAISQILPKAKPKPVPAKKPTPEIKPTVKPKTSAPQAELKANQISADTLEKYIPENVHFVQSKSLILPESKAALDQLAGFLIRYPNIKVTVEGHTDVIGEAAVNQKLSEERAKTVATYLSEKGVIAHRLRTIGYGSTLPLFKNDVQQGDARNRRVVFILE